MVAVLESRHRRVYCSTCGGVGEVYDRTTGRLVTCPVCNGTGLPPKSMAKPSDPIRMCGKCGGTGRVRDPKTGDLIDCKVCHGSGAVR
jgi:DnaJ-class molecular chaperone